MVVCCFSGQKRHGAAGEAKEALPVPVASSSSSSSSSASSASVVIRNFNSMYDHPSADSDDDDVGSDASADSEASLSAAMASRRLTRPDTTGNSNSILISAAADPAVSVLSSVRVGVEPRCSPDPHEEFRSSMAEMVAALGLGEAHQDDRLELQQLLLCYLALNRKDAHKYIVGAFAELLRGLPPPPAAADDR